MRTVAHSLPPRNGTPGPCAGDTPLPRIAELSYCGAIGYIGFDGNMDTNIASRTLVQHGDMIYAWAGGGIVADSDPEAEYQESLHKAAALLAVLDPAGSRRVG